MSEDLKTKILKQVKDDFAAVEAALKDNLGAHLDVVSDVAGHLLFAGGKRLRPLLMILSARVCGYKGNRAPFFSTVFEYLHTATLLHDDLVDGADLRRNRPAAYQVWNAPIAVLAGDFLLARSLTIASETESTDVIRVIAGITENMSQGEIHQMTQKQNLNLSEAEYMEIIRRKTAVLIEGSCRVGALISGVSEEKTDVLTSYGHHLGMAFQMADDLLDYTADTQTLGKAVGADLREGKLTLPVIYALASASDADRTEMERIITDPEFSETDFSTLLQLLEQYGGIVYTRRKAVDYIRIAKEKLTVFEASEARTTLEDIADYALARSV